VLQHSSGAITWFQFAAFAPYADHLTHGVFARQGGVSPAPYTSLNGGATVGDDPELVAVNRARIQATLPGNMPLFTAHPVHGAQVVEVTPEAPARSFAGATILDARADAMITRDRGLAIFWAYADCTPILIFDPVHTAIALVHAGWNGASQGVALAALQALREAFGSRPADLIVGVAPTIGPCCYEVDARVQQAFDANPLARDTAYFSTALVPAADGDLRPSLRLDLAATNCAQLLAGGVPEDHIDLSGVCTGCRRDLFFSHRMENSQTGRFAVVIGLR
jgi:YfiH family protein